MDSTVIIVLLGAILAGFVQGLSGFAFGMVSMSVWVWVLPPNIAAALAILGALVGQVMGTFTVRRGFEWRRLLPFLWGGLLGIPLGMLLLRVLDPVLFRLCVGLVLLTVCPLMFFASKLPDVTQLGRRADACIGMIGGMMSMIGGFAGTVPALWCTLRGWDKPVQRAVIQNFSLATLSLSAVVYLASGLLPIASLSLLAVVLPAMLIPNILGARVYRGINEQSFRRIVLSLLIMSGLIMTGTSIPVLIGRWL